MSQLESGVTKPDPREIVEVKIVAIKKVESKPNTSKIVEAKIYSTKITS